MPNAVTTPVHSIVRYGALAVMTTLALQGCGHGLVGATALDAGGFEAEAARKKARAPKAAPVPQSAAATTYYRAIGASLTGKTLLAALHKLIDGHKELTYDDARTRMFATVDDGDNDNVVQDVYTGRKVPGITDRVSAFQRGMNAEHTWCQSMGAKEGPAHSDLHHIFPTDAGANSTRNNLAFGLVTKGEGTTLPDFAGDGLHSRVGEGAGHQTVFEPRADHRGDVARAMFYVYTRYVVGAASLGAFKLDNFKVEQTTLLRWATEDPVSAKELARNEAIYKIQGNRNPFIDHPEYIKRVGAFLTAGRNEAVAE